MAGYSAGVAVPADLAAIWPGYTDCVTATFTAAAVLADSYAEVYRSIQKQCKAAGHDVTEVLSSAPFKKLECYLALAKLCEGSLNPQIAEGTLASAKVFRQRFEKEMGEVEWEYDPDVAPPGELHEQEAGATGPRWFRG